jgi:type II secretory pathway component PulM
LGYSDDASTVVYGVYGEAGGPDDPGGLFGHTKWAGYFPGYTYTPGGIWSSSDENLKENIEPYPTDLAYEKLMSITPIRFDFNTGGFPRLGLPSGPQIGVGATNVQQVLPELVMDARRPADVNSDGDVIMDEMMMKLVNYQGFIPLLIAGYQQQAQQMQQQQTQLSAVQEELNEALATIEQLSIAQLAQFSAMSDCCQQASIAVGAVSGASNDLRTERLQIIPNPVAVTTMLRYYVPRAGRVRLELSAEDGRALETLLEMRAMEGEQQYTWDTSHLSAGVYLVALMVDDQVVVKRAVKVE